MESLTSSRNSINISWRALRDPGWDRNRLPGAGEGGGSGAAQVARGPGRPRRSCLRRARRSQRLSTSARRRFMTSTSNCGNPGLLLGNRFLASSLEPAKSIALRRPGVTRTWGRTPKVEQMRIAAWGVPERPILQCWCSHLTPTLPRSHTLTLRVLNPFNYIRHEPPDIPLEILFPRPP